MPGSTTAGGLFRAEMYRWLHAPSGWVAMLVLTVVDAALYLGAVAPYNETGISGTSGVFLGIVGWSTNAASGIGPTFVIVGSDIPAMILAAIFIGSFFSHGTIQLPVALGHRRTRIYLSKLAAMSLWWVVFAILNGLLGVACMAAVQPWVGALTAGAVAYVALVAGTQAVLGLAKVAIFTTIAFITRSSGLRFWGFLGWVSLIAKTVSDIYQQVFHDNRASELFLNFYTGWLASVMDGQAPHWWPDALVCLVWFAVAVIIGCVWFNRSDLK